MVVALSAGGVSLRRALAVSPLDPALHGPEPSAEEPLPSESITQGVGRCRRLRENGDRYAYDSEGNHPEKYDGGLPPTDCCPLSAKVKL